MKKWLTLALVIAHLAAFTGLADAQQPRLKQPSRPLPKPTNYQCNLEIKKGVNHPAQVEGQFQAPLVSGQGAIVTIKVFISGTGCLSGSFPGTVVRDNQPTGLTFTAPPVVNQPGWQCGLELPVHNATCATQNPLQAGYSVTFQINATVTALPGSSVTNCATVSNPTVINPAKACVTIPVM